MPACIYQEKTGRCTPKAPICNAVCDAGQTLCPRHIVVVKADADHRIEKERNALVNKAQAAKHRRRGRRP
jgi:hypothetical protein